MEILSQVCVAGADIFHGNSSAGRDSHALGCSDSVPVVVPASARVFLLPWHVKFGQVPGFKSTVFIGVWRHPASIQPQKTRENDNKMEKMSIQSSTNQSEMQCRIEGIEFLINFISRFQTQFKREKYAKFCFVIVI